MILLEGFLVRLMIGITKNPFRRIINVTFFKSQNKAAVESSRRVPTKDEARKWYADIKPIILCTDQGENNKGVVLKSC